jgi:hypothetical protein
MFSDDSSGGVTTRFTGFLPLFWLSAVLLILLL